MLRRLGAVYKQLNAPFGQFGMDALAISTRAIRSGSSSNDSTYTALTNALISFTDRRDALASKIRFRAGGGAIRGTGARRWRGPSPDRRSRDLAGPGAERSRRAMT